MQTVAASVILEDAFRLLGKDIDQLEARQEADARLALSRAVQYLWDRWWWESLMVCELAALAVAYQTGDVITEADIAADSIRYFPATRKYYQALQPQLGIPPASLDASGAYVVNAGFWLEYQNEATNPRGISEDVDNTQAYEHGDLVLNPDDGLAYVRCGSVQVTVNGVPDAADNFVPGGSGLNGRPLYGAVGSNFTISIRASAPWQIIGAALGDFISQGEPPLTPDLVTQWFDAGDLGYSTPLDVVVTANFVAPAPGDTGSWREVFTGNLTPEIRGAVRTISKLDPRTTSNPTIYDFQETADGVEVFGVESGKAWIWSRRVTPVITGDAFSATATYTATDPSELVFDS